MPDVFSSVPLWMMILGFLLVLGPLIVVHELGHYLVGRWFGVKAEAFSVGFGKELLGYTDRRGTRWKLSALPFGGYVQFAGDMNPASQPSEDWLKLPEKQRNETFQSKPLWQRALIVFAGPATNFLVAIAIFASFNLIYGKVHAPAEIARFSKDSVAEAAGLEVGDVILAVDGEQIRQFDELGRKVFMYPGRTITLEVERAGNRLEVPLTIGEAIETDRFGNESRVGRIGVYSGEPQVVSVGPVEAVSLSFTQTANVVNMMVAGIGQIFVGERSLDELGGPIKIAKFSGEQLSLGPEAFVAFVALISINLGFINLLPIPALDGGHLAFYAAEAVRRKPVSPRGQEWAFRTGIAFVLALMLFVTVNDIVSFVSFGR